MVVSASTPLPAWPMTSTPPNLPQQVAQFVARELLVVHQTPHATPSYAVTRSGMDSSGISMLAHVPSPGMLLSFS